MTTYDLYFEQLDSALTAIWGWREQRAARSSTWPAAQGGGAGVRVAVAPSEHRRLSASARLRADRDHMITFNAFVYNPTTEEQLATPNSFRGHPHPGSHLVFDTALPGLA